MFYQLAPQYLLRGWEKLPTGVVDTRTGKTLFTNNETMKVLKLCDGKIDFSLPLVDEKYREIAAALCEKNIVLPCEKPRAILPVQEYRSFANRYISMAHWSITGRCNYRCKHCYMSAGDAKYGELSHEAIMKIIDELADCGIYTVSLTGGEPLVRPDFWEIVDALRERNICIETIYSNGFLVNEKLLQGLRDRGLDPEFNMSFDGTEGWHDWLRGVPGATAHIDRAFELCREYGFSTAAEMCLHERNKHVLRDSINHLAAMGCRELKTNPVSDEGAWHDNGYGQSISTEDLYDLYLNYIPQYYQDGKPLRLLLGGFFSAEPGSDRYFIPAVKGGCTDMDKATLCGHARNVMYISPEGRALPCFSLCGLDIQKEYPLIPEKGLRYCLTDSSYMKLIEAPASKVLNHNERCISCEYAAACRGGCRACALETTPDDIFGIDESTCRIFKGGYIEKIMDTVAKAAPEAFCGSFPTAETEVGG